MAIAPKPKVGIALGGGGAKGLAHIGVLCALEEMGIQFEVVVGTSIGAVIGGLYAVDGKCQGLKEKAERIIRSDDFQSMGLNAFIKKETIFDKLAEKFFMGKLLFKEAQIDTVKTEGIFRELFEDLAFEQTRIPFATVALDLTTGEDFVFDHGPLMIGTWASAAIPGIFPPVVYDERILIDGGVTTDLPVRVCQRYGVDLVFGIYLGSHIMRKERFKTGFQILKRSAEILNFRINEPNLVSADVLIHPHLDHIHWADFSKIDECIEEGRNAVLRRQKEIKESISLLARIKRFFRLR
ncbi:MAG TPA: patatin-like phospholipase family protein [bacterium (Candidatus Stahlbacteria)]|nr:patatin-like phospholipase family protein [Candidatus Stahlbacteria bacterium]